MGLAFSGGTATRCLPEPEVETGEGDGEAIGVGADVCAAAVTDSNASTLNRIGYFAAIKANRPTNQIPVKARWFWGSFGRPTLML